MTDTKTQEQRRFSRINFDSNATIRLSQGDTFTNCKVHDISLNGILIEPPPQLRADSIHQKCLVTVYLMNTDAVISMEAVIAHITEKAIGMSCEEIDLESITHLKRLVELNLGDEILLHRELDALIAAHD